jgi:Cu(I)/Ag(I) efflux system periplasmic protein CusF
MKRFVPHVPLAPLVLLVAAALGAPALHAQPSLTDGEVTKIDKAQVRITLRHGEIRNLDMPPMTMSFRVADGKWLTGLAVGDHVRFSAEKLGGTYTVTKLSKAD